jgi:hypothetical protein
MYLFLCGIHLHLTTSCLGSCHATFHSSLAFQSICKTIENKLTNQTTSEFMEHTFSSKQIVSKVTRKYESLLDLAFLEIYPAMFYQVSDYRLSRASSFFFSHTLTFLCGIHLHLTTSCLGSCHATFHSSLAFQSICKAIENKLTNQTTSFA